MKYLIPIILIFLIGGQIVLANGIDLPENPKPMEKFYEKIQNNIINPMKQIPKKIENVVQGLIQTFQNKAENKTEEIKQEIKQGIKSEAEQQIENQKKSWGDRIKIWLTPLKNKIQEGREILRGWLDKAREFIF